MGEAALVIQGLRRTFNPGTAGEVRALQGVDLSVEAGAFVIMLGTNGSGKSTLLNAIAGTTTVDGGSLVLDGTDLTGWPEFRRARLIGRVFQDPFVGTAQDLTIAENLALASRRERQGGVGMALTTKRREKIREQVAELNMGLEDRVDTPMGALSGGQRQALTLLMATVAHPRLLLLDEHTAALDVRSEEQVLRITQEVITRDSLTTLLVTHSLEQAVRMGDRVVIMHRGRIAIDFSGMKKRMLRVEDLLDRFDRLRAGELLDEPAAELLRRTYV